MQIRRGTSMTRVEIWLLDRNSPSNFPALGSGGRPRLRSLAAEMPCSETQNFEPARFVTTSFAMACSGIASSGKVKSGYAGAYKIREVDLADCIACRHTEWVDRCMMYPSLETGRTCSQTLYSKTARSQLSRNVPRPLYAGKRMGTRCWKSWSSGVRRSNLIRCSRQAERPGCRQAKSWLDNYRRGREREHADPYRVVDDTGLAGTGSVHPCLPKSFAALWKALPS